MSSAAPSTSRRFGRPRRAVVIGRWADDAALVRTEDGTTLEVRVPEELRAGFDVGAEVRLDGEEDRLVALVAPEAG